MPVQSKLGLDTISEGWKSVESNNATHSASDSEVRTASSDSSEGPTFQHIEDISTYVEPDTDNEHTITESQENAGLAQSQAADDPLTGHAPDFDDDDDGDDVPSDSSTAGSVSCLSLSSSDSVAGSEHASQSASVFRGLERASATGVEDRRSSPVRSLAIPSGLSCVTDQYGNIHRRVKPFGNSPRFHGFPRLRVSENAFTEIENSTKKKQMAARGESPEDEEFSVLGNGDKRSHAHRNEIAEETNTNEIPSQTSCHLATKRCGVRFPRSSVSSDGDNTHTTPFSELYDDCRAARLATINDESDTQSSIAFSWSAPGSPVPSFVSGFFGDDNEEEEGEGEEELSQSQLSLLERPAENGVGNANANANANATEQSTDGEAVQEQADAANVSAVGEPDVAEPDQLAIITVTPVFGAALTAGTATAITAGGVSTVRTEATIRHDLSDNRNKDKHGEIDPTHGHVTVTYDSASGEERALDIVEYEHGRESQSNHIPTPATGTSTNGVDANTTPASEFPCVVNETTANRDREYDADEESTDGALLLVDVDSPGVSPESGYMTGLAAADSMGAAGSVGYEAVDDDDEGWI